MKKQGGGKFEPGDFMRWGRREPEPEATPEQLFAMLKAAAASNPEGKN